MLQAPETNPEGEEAAEATEVVAAQAVVVGGLAAIEVPNRRAIRTDRKATQIDRRAIQTELRSQDRRATSVRKRGIGSRNASDI